MTDAPDDSASRPDLAAIERDLADVELALSRLDSGAYWTDEVTGAPLPRELLECEPTARRAPTAAVVTAVDELPTPTEG